MNILKRTMAMLLVLCMLFGAAPFHAFAEEGEETAQTTEMSTEAPEETAEETETPTEAPEETAQTTEAPAEAPEETAQTTEAPTEAPEETAQVTETPTEAPEESSDAAEMPTEEEDESTDSTEVPEETTEAGVIEEAAEAELMNADKPTKPADGTTTGEPFPQGTGGSNSFRIPALVTLSDGTLVAAADARWNTTYDGGGLDTIVSWSDDDGATWNYTFANYLGDNGNEYNGSGSTAFIDPALAVTADDTIYMLVDLYPYGVALNGSGNTSPTKTSNGFNDDGKLLLSGDSHTSYGYYLDGTQIKSTNGTVVSGLTVDAHFNITGTYNNTTYDTNLFFSDSPFKVTRTGFLYLTTSTDGGKNWSVPTLLDIDRASDTEMVTLVGPGRGLVTSGGMIVFPVYSFHGDNDSSDNTQRMSFIYSTDGVTWNRTSELNHNWASESAVVELKDGTLRFFFRNGTSQICYVDYKDDAWGTPVKTGIAANSNTQLSAISLQDTINNGQQVILVSCPQGSTTAGDNNSSGSARLNGKIHLFAVGANNALTKVSTVDVPSVNSTNSFMYSCLTAQKDSTGDETGTISILYEDNEAGWGTGDGKYYQMSYAEYDVETAFNVTFDEDTDDSVVNVTLKVGDTVTRTIDGVALTGSNADTSIATVTWTGTTVEGSTTEKLTAATVPTSAGSVECYISDGKGNYLTLSNGTLTNATSAANATKWTVTWFDTPAWDTNTDNMSRYRISSGSYYIDMNNGVLGVTTGDTNINHWYTAENGFFGGFAGTNGWQYANGSWTAVNTAGYGNANAYTVETVTNEASASTNVSITGNAVGTTAVTVGTTTYNITVTAANVTNVVNVTLKVNETKTYTDASGVYTTATIEPDDTIATMDVVGESGVSTETVSTTKATELEAGATYILRVYDTNQALSSNSGRGDWGTTTRAFETNDLIVNEDHLWTLEAVEGGYKLKNADGYLNLGTGNNTAYLDETGEVFTITYTDTGWTIGNQSGRYINALGGLYTYYSAGGWTGDGTRFDLYKVISSTPASTEVTFTGVAPGNTTAVVGNTQYNITVVPDNTSVVNVELMVGQSKSYADNSGNYENATGNVQPNGTYATMTVTASDALREVTAIESGKQYLIANAATGAVLRNSEITVPGDYENKTGLETEGTASAYSTERWTITSVDGGYTVVQDNEYLTVAGFQAGMSETSTPLTLTYTDAGWTIYDYTTGPAAGHTAAGYYLSDNVGSNHTGGALGTEDTTNTYRYWKIYEIVEDSGSEVTFTGVTPGNTTAVVGNTTYNITVRNERVITINYQLNGATVRTDYEVVAYDATTYALPETVNQDGITYKVIDDELTLDAAVSVYNVELQEPRIITIEYLLGENVVKTEEVEVEYNATGYDLPVSMVINGVLYTVNENELTLADGTTSYQVTLSKLGAAGNGFLGFVDGDETTEGGDKPITEMTLTPKVTYDLDLKDTLTDGQTVEWVSGNTGVVTVDENGNVTAVGAGETTITAIVKNADGTVASANTIPITVLDNGDPEDYRTVAVYVEEVIHTTAYCVINDDTENAIELSGGELFYGYFKKGTGGDTDPTTTTGLSFFGTPDKNHALVKLGSTNSNNQYMLLHDGNGNMVDADGYYYDTQNNTNNSNRGAGYWLAVGLAGNNEENPAYDKVGEIVEWAIEKGADGGMGFTRRQAEGNLSSNISFISDPMPTMDKSINGILPNSRKQADFRLYQDGMVAAVGELVYYTVTITLERPTVFSATEPTKGAITYDDAFIADKLGNAYFYTKDLDKADGVYDGVIEDAYQDDVIDITDDLNAAWGADETVRKLEYFVVYEIVEADIPKFNINNVVELSFDYQSAYSTGAQSGTADAQARITVVGKAMDDVVIDFGQTIVYTGLDNSHLKGVYVDDQVKYDAQYGTVTVTSAHRTDANGNYLYDVRGYPLYDYTVTYTPTAILQSADAVRLYGLNDDNQEKVINAFMVYPATSVYYEEGFMFNAASTDWDVNNAKKATQTQTLELLGKSQYDVNNYMIGRITDKKHPYGYDPIYDPSVEGENKVADSWASTSTVGAKTQFAFTGTGFELYANCTEATGTVAVMSSGNKLMKLYTVNTVVGTGDTEATNPGQSKEFDSLPVISVKNLPHDTYTVLLRNAKASNGKQIIIDGIRIINTLENSKDFAIDKEDYPMFIQIRDMVMHQLGVENITDSKYGTLEQMADQVYRKDTEATAIVTDAKVTYANSNTLKDLLDNGPKNELFLYPNQTLTFKVQTNRSMQIGLKAPKHNADKVTVVVNNGTTSTTVIDAKSFTASEDMFYDLVVGPTDEVITYTVTVTNGGTGVLSITDLKICDDPDAVLVPLTAEDIKQILIDTNKLDAPVVAESNVSATGKIKLEWDAVEGAAGYEILRRAGKNGEYELLATVAEPGMIDSDATPGTVYYYKVRALHDNEDFSSDYSKVVYQTCDLPRPVVEESNDSNSGAIKLEWEAIEGAEKYKIYRRVGKSGDYEYYKSTTSNKYTDKNTTPGIVYYYKVVAVHANTSANSAKSAGVGQTCHLPRPVVEESNVTSSGKIKLEWEKIEGAEKYKIYRRVGKSGDYEYYKSTTSNKYTDKNTTPGIIYYYKVKAVHANTSANSAKSSGVGQTCKLERPDVSIKLSSGNPKLTWDEVEGAKEYRVYRATSKNGTYKLVKTTASEKFTDKSVTAGKTYYYKVKAIHTNSNANSAYSSIDSIKAK